MRIIRKVAVKQSDIWNMPPVTIAFLGDSVTQGCFDVFTTESNQINTVFQQHSGYPHKVGIILRGLFPRSPVNIINAGLSGDNAVHALERLERDILSHNPDLVVISLGLNDSTQGLDYLPQYEAALSEILIKLIEKEIEVIFMTQNMMNTYVSCHIKETTIRELAEKTCNIQNNGIFEQFVIAAKAVCQKHKVPVCDCYSKWKKLCSNGVDVTEQLANKINHPKEEMHWLFAISLVETMFDYEQYRDGGNNAREYTQEIYYDSEH